jgi:cobalt-precorrin-5B (C1)-methyltransferase
VGGMLKYIRTHPVPQVTIAGGVAKISKLAQGLLDLHSKRGTVDLPALADAAQAAGGSSDLINRIVAANTAAEAFALAAEHDIALGDQVAITARATAARVVESAGVAVEVVMFDREGRLVGCAPFDHAAPPRNRRR